TGKGTRELKLVSRARNRFEVVVVRREDDTGAERAEEVDERRARARRRNARLGVARTKAERALPVVDGKHADAGAAKRADRSEAGAPADADDPSRRSHCRRSVRFASRAARIGAEGVRQTIEYGVGTPPNERTNDSTCRSMDPSKSNAVPRPD